MNDQVNDAPTARRSPRWVLWFLLLAVVALFCTFVMLTRAPGPAPGNGAGNSPASPGGMASAPQAGGPAAANAPEGPAQGGAPGVAVPGAPAPEAAAPAMSPPERTEGQGEPAPTASAAPSAGTDESVPGAGLPPPLSGQPEMLAAARRPAPHTPAAPRSAAATADQYRLEVARQIHAKNAAELFPGIPPNPLKAVIIYQIEIDQAGRPVTIQLLRSPGNAELERKAVASVRAAAPYAVPGGKLTREGRVKFLETWLFDWDDHFQLRSLAAAQSAG